jgi:hypothetical protein
MQFIGELTIKRVSAAEQERLVLVARVARCVDGLDMALYADALAARRASE